MLIVWIAIGAVVLIVVVAGSVHSGMRWQRMRDEDPSRKDPRDDLWGDFAGIYARRRPRPPADKNDRERDK